MKNHSDFKGNKSSLPSKVCLACGRVMTWRKSWEKNWDDVRYCSQRCRSDVAKSRKPSNLLN